MWGHSDECYDTNGHVLEADGLVSEANVSGGGEMVADGFVGLLGMCDVREVVLEALLDGSGGSASSPLCERTGPQLCRSALQ